MKIANIITRRDVETWPCWDLVFEWENVFKRAFGACLISERLVRRLNTLVFRYRFLAKNLQFPLRGSFVIDLYCKYGWRGYIKEEKLIPFIVDITPSKSDIKGFIECYKHNPVVFVSNKDAYNFLVKHGVAEHVNIKHLALSLPDKYRIKPTSKYEKIYDVVLMGRQNPLLETFLKKYASTHETFTYVYRTISGDSFSYITNHGECLGMDFNSRDKYIDLMRKSRVFLYAVPGLDNDEKFGMTNGYHWMTPRFLEAIASGCHIIARYEKNADTDFFEVEKFSPSVSEYGEFEQLMDAALDKEIDIEMYSTYLEKHYTSVRAQEVKEIIKEL